MPFHPVGLLRFAYLESGAKNNIVPNSEHISLTSLFTNQEEKNKAAALKNAYVLMGKHELKLAIAFFLLGGDSSSAVTVCAKNLGDDQLALVICRLLEGYGGSLEKQLISNNLLPKALEKGDYWLSSLLEVCVISIPVLVFHVLPETAKLTECMIC